MKANEYIKEYGLDIAKKAVSECTYGYGVDLIELKRLVKSHELVDSVGGLGAANRIVCDAFHGSNGDIPEGHEKLSLAIADVEACQ